MRVLDLNLPTPEENLACDEALLDWCETGGPADGILRLWEATHPFVVVGYANDIAREVHLEVCRRLGVPVLRRCTGGGTVLQAPGCLNYSLVLPITSTLESITATNSWIMQRNADAVARLISAPVTVEGHTDLAINQKKFSGNAQRRKRRFLLFHGSFLLVCDFALMEQVLASPSKQPAYRQNRRHSDFLMALHVPAEQVKNALTLAWDATDSLEVWPRDLTARLVKTKYSTPGWNAKKTSP